MATTDGAVTPQSPAAEAAVSASPLESEDPTSVDNHPSNTPPTTPPQPQILETLPPSPRHFFNSVTEFKDVLDAISAFQQCYDNLRNHLDSVKAAILAKLPAEAPQITQQTALLSSPNPDVPNEESELQKQQEEEQIAPEPEFLDLCKTMCSRGVRRYLAIHLSNRPMLREQVPKALREAPNPPKLVLECLGKFFLQGSKAFSRNSPMIPAREASIQILECFLLMIGMNTNIQDSGGALNIEKAVKDEADIAAIAWRKRLISEGGVAKASKIDARGLLLFVACFGIPALFKVEDIRDLVIAANAKEIVSVLQKSHVLMSKISDIVEEMMKKKMEVDAVDIVYTFGLEQRFNPQSILVSFLRESKEAWKKSRKGAHGSIATLNEANKKQLAALKSIKKCLERHKIDPAKLLPGWQINDKISSLEKDIINPDKKAPPSQKRKPSETETSQKAKGQEAKRPRFKGQQHKGGASSHINNRRNLTSQNYSAPQPVIYGGPGAGLVPHQNIIPQHGGPTIISTYGVAPHDAASRQQIINPFSWHRDSPAPAVEERYYNYSNSISASHNQPPPASLGLASFYRPATTPAEGFSGNIANNGSSLVGNRGGAPGGAATSDPYHFVDSVVAESEWYPTTVATTVVLPPSHHHSSAYLYQV